MKVHEDVFLVPVTDRYLLYAPLHRIQALIDSRAADEIRQGLAGRPSAAHPSVQPLLHELLTAEYQRPANHSGPQPSPLFLGIIPTRGCNMGCRYCDFAAPKKESPVMSLELARAAVDGTLRLLREQGKRHLEIQFFGGEPFYAAEVVDFVCGYAAIQAKKQGFSLRLEVTTNGFFSARRARWIASTFDSVVLSLDGPGDIQNAVRPGPNGRDTFAVVERSAQIFSEGESELVIRACITRETTDRLPEIARWIADSFRPSTVCLENLTQSPYSESSGLKAPDPWEFAYRFDQARSILATVGIGTVLSTAETEHNQASFCPVGKDAVIVSPDGAINACYLLPESWEDASLDMVLGQVRQVDAGLEIENRALDRVRGYDVYGRTLCDACFCRYHCAGGCHVHHDTSSSPGEYDDLCLMTRLTTTARLLRALEQDELVESWFQDRNALESSAWQANDRLLQWEMAR